MIKVGPLDGKKGSQKKKNILRTRAHAQYKKNIRRAVGFKQGRPAALRRTRCLKSKPEVFMGVYSLNIHRRLKKLQTLIPGGTSVSEVEVLFKKTADYIVSLKMQLCLLQALSHICGGINA